MFGDYPPEMRRIHGNELPRFSAEESLLLSKSIDFIGINHYGTLYAKDCIHSSCICNDSSCTAGSDRAVRGFVSTSGDRDGVPIGELVSVNSLFKLLILVQLRNILFFPVADWNGSILCGSERHGRYSRLY